MNFEAKLARFMSKTARAVAVGTIALSLRGSDRQLPSVSQEGLECPPGEKFFYARPDHGGARAVSREPTTVYQRMENELGLLRGGRGKLDMDELERLVDLFRSDEKICR